MFGVEELEDSCVHDSPKDEVKARSVNYWNVIYFNASDKQNTQQAGGNWLCKTTEI